MTRPRCMMDIICLVLVTCSLVTVGAFDVSFDVLSNIRLPYTYTPRRQYAVNAAAAEQMAYDHVNKLLYSVGTTNIHVIDISDVTTPRVVFHTSIPDIDVTDVEYCGGYVFVTMDNLTRSEDGVLYIYDAYNTLTNTLDVVHTISVGAVPDMIKVTQTCTKLVIAVEGEPYDDVTKQTLVDPPGTVTIVTFSNTPAGNYTVKVLDFTQFDNRVTDLERQGVRFVYRENNNTFSNDVEPEYIAFNADETKAYICLQENNAIAVVDLVTDEITGIHGLGFKDWGSSSIGLDVSDRDSSIDLRPWPVFGMYQPDAIHHVTIGGVAYLLTANEGGSKDYTYFSEETRVKKVTLSEAFEPNATLRNQFQEDSQLGRLKITTENGRNASTGEFDQLYTFGGRSFSILRADTLDMVYDSGSDIGERTALNRPALFNNNVKVGVSAAAGVDTRSDDKGCETESLAIAHFGDTTLLFVGNERPGTIFVYSIDGSQSRIEPKFETIIDGVTRTDDTWDNLVDAGYANMLDPEDIKFVPAEDSPISDPILLVSGSSSGTISIIKVTVTDRPTGDTSRSTQAHLDMAMFVNLLLVSATVIYSDLAVL